jgi:acetyltransferase
MLDEVDFLDYLAEDPETEVICIYLEDMRRGRDFLESARKCMKPVIVYKANITPYGEAAAGTHTAAMKNDEQVMDCAFRQAGVIRAKSLIEMFNLAKAFSLPPMKGNRLLVLSPSGGLAVILGDLAWKYGFELPPIPRELYDKYSGQRRAGVIDFKNPLDFGDIYSAEVQRNFLRELLRHESFDGLAMAYLYRDPEMLKLYMNLNQLQRDIVSEFIETVDTIKKPVGCILSVPYHLKESVQARSPYPIFDNPEDAVACMATLRDYYVRAEKKKKQNL